MEGVRSYSPLLRSRPSVWPSHASTRRRALTILDTAGNKFAEPTDAHSESFQLEQSGTRVFINVPDKREIQFADLGSRRQPRRRHQYA
jgi:hypothetical protein